MAKFSMNCEGSSTKSHHTLVPERLSNRVLANIPCSEWPNSWRNVSTSPKVSSAGFSAVTELEVGNILRKRNVNDYLLKYGILSGEIPMTEAMKKKKEKQKKGQTDELKKAREKIADLESLLNTDHLSDYEIPEND